MKPEPKKQIDSIEKFVQSGIPQEWAEIMKELEYETVAEAREIKHTKLHQQICGYNKKNKLGLSNPTPDQVKEWMEE
jgi:lysyl-tRNA synthetase class 2